MDKCTNEQFWAVASLTAADAFFASQKNTFTTAPHWLCMTLLTLATVYGVSFIIHRHLAYFQIYNARATLLQGEPHAPAFMTQIAPMYSIRVLSGVLFYIGWVIAGYVMCWYAH